MNDFRANKWLTRFSSENESEIFTKTIPYISLIGIVGHPVFYLICTNLGYYDNLVFRITASVLFLLLLIIKRKNSVFFTIYSEVIYTLTLPFLFSFFLYTNDQNMYWKLSMLFAGAAYGMLVQNVVRSLLVIPLSCMLSFVCVNIFFQVTTVAYFYDSISTIVSAIGCAIIMIVAKNALKFMIFISTEMAADNKRIEEHRKQKELAQKNLQIQREIHLAQRLRLIADMSEGISREIGDALTVIRDQASLINVNNKNESRKEKIQTVIRIAENATATVGQFDIFLKHNQVKPPIKG
jgi:hypothetical protein